jgi:hypothetical protein
MPASSYEQEQNLAGKLKWNVCYADYGGNLRRMKFKGYLCITKHILLSYEFDLHTTSHAGSVTPSFHCVPQRQ